MTIFGTRTDVAHDTKCLGNGRLLCATKQILDILDGIGDSAAAVSSNKNQAVDILSSEARVPSRLKCTILAGGLLVSETLSIRQHTSIKDSIV